MSEVLANGRLLRKVAKVQPYLMLLSIDERYVVVFRYHPDAKSWDERYSRSIRSVELQILHKDRLCARHFFDTIGWCPHPADEGMKKKLTEMSRPYLRYTSPLTPTTDGV